MTDTNVNVQSIVDSISEANVVSASKKDIKAIIDATIAEITSQLSQGNTVRLSGLGIFSVKERAAREGRNPQTGAALSIPATKVVRFSVAKALKDAVKA